MKRGYRDAIGNIKEPSPRAKRGEGGTHPATQASLRSLRTLGRRGRRVPGEVPQRNTYTRASPFSFCLVRSPERGSKNPFASRHEASRRGASSLTPQDLDPRGPSTKASKDSSGKATGISWHSAVSSHLT